jgi:DNA-binding NarL/FixJ family response regulator
VRRTILIVDDHAQFRRAARALFEADGYNVVGEAADGRSAIEAASSLRPDIVLLDVQLPDLDGFEVARRMVDAGLSAAIVLTSTRDRASYRRRLAQSPARGFIPKSELVGAAIEELTA